MVGNSRNGTTGKTVVGKSGPLAIETPWSRNGEFEPELAKKSQHRATVVDQEFIPLYAKGVGTRDIASTIEDLYDTEDSRSLNSKFTKAVIDGEFV